MDAGGKIAVFKVKDVSGHGDVSVFVRTKASNFDREMFARLQDSAVRELMRGGNPRISHSVASLFACGWHGVEVGGVPLQYSWAVLEEVFPQSTIDALGKFCSENVDILKTA